MLSPSVEAVETYALWVRQKKYQAPFVKGSLLSCEILVGLRFKQQYMSNNTGQYDY